MPSRTLIAAAIGIPLLIGTVLVVKASSSSSDSDDPAAAKSVDKPTKPGPRPPSATLPPPKLPRYERPAADVQPPPAAPAAAPTTPPADTDTSKATDPVPSAADRDKRREIVRQHGRPYPEFAMKNPGVVDSASQAEIDAKADILRKRKLMDKFACNAPESKERLELLSPAERAKWEQRCGIGNATTTPSR